MIKELSRRDLFFFTNYRKFLVATRRVTYSTKFVSVEIYDKFSQI